MSQTAITVTDVSVHYQQATALQNISVTINSGTMTAIVGPNGAGKSTLMKAILHLLPLASGHIEINEMHQRTDVAYVPQTSSVNWDFPTTVFDVVLMGRYGQLGWLKRPNKQDRLLTKAALTQMGMTDFADRHISALSGGQKQRVFLARALVQDAKYYLLDEPLQGVDKQTEQTIIDTLHQLRDAGRTIVVVHHDLSTVPAYFDQVILLNKTLVAAGDVDTTFTRENIEKTYGQQLLFGTTQER